MLVLEDNLMWSVQLQKSLKALGHEVQVESTTPAEASADIAIINLGSSSFPPEATVPLVKGWGMKVIAHAGHKEKDLHQVGAGLGCDVLCTNSELTWKLENVLNRVKD